MIELIELNRPCSKGVREYEKVFTAAYCQPNYTNLIEISFRMQKRYENCYLHATKELTMLRFQN